MNPYEVLGVSENADAETVKKAYRDLVKKYHPDKYVNNPLADLASEKLKEINKAYDMIMNSNASSYGGNTDSSHSAGYGASSKSADFRTVRMLINQNRLNEAEQMLITLSQNAEWHYLMGLIYIKKGWYNKGIQHLQTAVRLDPSNLEYSSTLNNFTRSTTQYRTTYNTGSNVDYCDCCAKLICADCCCECMGGDLIPCC